jgi:hypothetical protein
MGRLWGAGGWIGPRSRLGDWISRRWWRFYVALGVLGALVIFPVRYFGVLGRRDEHQIGPSLVGAIAFGVLFGAGMLAFEAWARRKSGREKG